MPFLLLILSNKRWCLIIVLIIYSIFQTWQSNKLAGHLKDAETKCTAKVQEIEQKQVKALAEKQNEINQVSADYETEKSGQRRQIETVTREVQKIVEHPIYLNNCFDDSGLQQLNSLINSDSSEPDSTLP